MKCPKCGYLGFETSDRCRNCGYDFSLAVKADVEPELPLHQKDGTGGPLADLALSPSHADDRRQEGTGCLDLDRLIGVAESPAAPAGTRGSDPAASAVESPVSSAASRTASRLDVSARPRNAVPAPPPGQPGPDGPLPLFSPAGDADESAPIAPRPAGAPLSVRRATPELSRGRSRSRVTPRRDAPALTLEPTAAESASAAGSDGADELVPAGAVARLAATAIDALLLATIDGAILYFTLAIAGLTMSEASALPPIPLGAFLLILNGGYLVAFTAASGQTIGKMATGILVMGDDSRRIDVAGAVWRAAGCALSVLSLGLGYLPAFFRADARALHDRIAGTRVVKA